MTLAGFQHALVELVLDPVQARRLYAGDESLFGRHALDASECARLRGVVRQPGLALLCTLARANRFEGVGEVFPMTCVLLEPVLRGLLDELWAQHPPTSYQFAGEEALFAAEVERRLRAGRLGGEYLAEVFAYERTCWDLAQKLRRSAEGRRDASTEVEFHHPPDRLLEPLSRLQAPPAGLPRGCYRARLSLCDGRFEVTLLKAQPEPA